MRKSPGSRPSEIRPKSGITIARITSAKNNVTSHLTMIELYTWTTPNGRKVSIMLEECGLPYRVHKINIGTNSEQFAPEYLKINPNGKIPSIVDPEGPDGQPIAMMESGAILIYPWVARYEWHRVDLGQFPNVKRWFDAIGARPAVQKGMAVPQV